MDIKKYDKKQEKFLDFFSNPSINITEFFGLRRSGNHAIIFWHLFNLSSNLQRRLFSRGCSGCLETNTFFFNDVNNKISDKVGRVLHEHQLKPTNLIISHEKVFSSCGKNTTKCLIMRDVINHCCSHYKKFFLPRIHINSKISEYAKTFIKHYKLSMELFEDSDVIPINYNEWVLNVNYRNELADKLHTNNKDITNFIPRAGGGSSFTATNRVDDKSVYFERYKMVKLPDEVRDVIVMDEKVRGFYLKYFNMDIKKII